MIQIDRSSAIAEELCIAPFCDPVHSNAPEKQPEVRIPRDFARLTQKGLHTMQKIAGIATPIADSVTVPGRLAVFNRRLLIAATVLILWGASVVALYAAGPHAQAMLAGEGMLVTGSE